MEYLNIALPKGRIADLTIKLFEAIGVDCSEIKSQSRKLIFLDEVNKIKFFLVKPSDVPTYVEYGAADIGIAGKDVLVEEGKHLYEVLDLGFGECKMVVAGPKELQGNIDNIIFLKPVFLLIPHLCSTSCFLLDLLPALAIATLAQSPFLFTKYRYPFSLFMPHLHTTSAI